MQIKHEPLKVDDADPFLHCKFGRSKYATILTEIVSSYAEGFVLAINNQWGTGKTTFLSMWQKLLEKQGYKACYFNAWQHDFDKNPMVAVISELKTITKDKSTKSFKSVVQKGGVLFKSLLPALAKAIARRYVDEETIVDAVEKGTEGTVDILKNEIDDYAKKKIGLDAFRVALKKFVIENANGKPLVFIIDELDRCRPDYAVEVLEQVKHFFNVEGIVFVLAIDKTQLLHAINGFYGSAQIDAAEYLRRFIDVEYSIPAPSTKDFCKYLFQYFHFEDFFHSEFRSKHQELNNDAEIFIEYSATLFEHHNLTLREQEKLYAHARIVIRSFPENNYNFPALFILLIYIRAYDKVFYDRIRRLEYPLQEVVDKINNFFPKEMNKFANVNSRSVEAMFAFFYYNSYLEKDYTSQLLVKGTNGSEFDLSIRSAFGFEDASSRLLQLIQEYQYKYTSVKITYLLNKIDLIETLVN